MGLAHDRNARDDTSYAYLDGQAGGDQRDLSDSGVYVRHADMAALEVGAQVAGQVQDLPFPAPVLTMEVVRVDAEGAGLRFLGED